MLVINQLILVCSHPLASGLWTDQQTTSSNMTKSLRSLPRAAGLLWILPLSVGVTEQLLKLDIMETPSSKSNCGSTSCLLLSSHVFVARAFPSPTAADACVRPVGPFFLCFLWCQCAVLTLWQPPVWLQHMLTDARVFSLSVKCCNQGFFCWIIDSMSDQLAHSRFFHFSSLIIQQRHDT